MSDITECAWQGNLAEVQRLIESGVSINSKAPVDGNSALIAASRWGQLEVVEYLVQAKADLNATNDVRDLYYYICIV